MSAPRPGTTTIPPTSRPRGPGEPLHRIRIGDVDVYPLVQLHYLIDPARFFPGIADWPVDESAWYWQEPYVHNGALAVDMGGFIVSTPDRVVLIDAGIGNDKQRPNPNFAGRQDGWLDLLPLIGIGRDDVDTVIFTHLHVDHVGFATTLVEGRWEPTFPHATYHTTAEEMQHWTSTQATDDIDRLGGYIADSVTPLEDAGVLVISPADLQICREIRLVPSAGHTPGNVCVEVRSQGQRGVFVGDMIHHPLQLAFPDRSTDYCVDAALATAARQRLLESMGEGDLLFPAHFPGSIPGRIAADGASYRYLPHPGEPV